LTWLGFGENFVRSYPRFQAQRFHPSAVASSSRVAGGRLIKIA
jgi:hypothetical protein